MAEHKMLKIFYQNLYREITTSKKSIYRMTKDLGLGNDTLNRYMKAHETGEYIDIQLSTIEKLSNYFQKDLLKESEIISN